MPRTARLVLPQYPHHVVHRGHNRQGVVAADGDYERYLATLAELKAKFDIKVYAWCLMTNHVHLLLEPSDVEQRSGTLWEGRYKSSVVQNDRQV